MFTAILVLLVFVGAGFAVYSTIQGQKASEINLELLKIADEIEKTKGLADASLDALEILNHVDNRERQISKLIRIIRSGVRIQNTSTAKVYSLSEMRAKRAS